MGQCCSAVKREKGVVLRLSRYWNAEIQFLQRRQRVKRSIDFVNCMIMREA
jgi:hypothetical protein